MRRFAFSAVHCSFHCDTVSGIVGRPHKSSSEMGSGSFTFCEITALHTACDQLALFCIAQKWVVALERVLWEESVLEWATRMLDFCEECSEKTLYNEKKRENAIEREKRKRKYTAIHPPVVARTTDFLLRKKVVWYTGG